MCALIRAYVRTYVGGVDYGFFPASQLNLTTVIRASETQLRYGIFLRDDNIVERVERFTVTLYLPETENLGRNVFLSGVTQAEVLITDDDGEGEREERVCVCVCVVRLQEMMMCKACL